LNSNEFVEIGIGEHAAWALRAVADDDVFEVARRDVTVEGLDRAAELRRCFGRSPQSIRWALALMTTLGRWSKAGRKR
jgi:hypothetical protein